jgi:hypothetical protein
MDYTTYRPSSHNLQIRFLRLLVILLMTSRVRDEISRCSNRRLDVRMAQYLLDLVDVHPILHETGDAMSSYVKTAMK